jgi:hypothetical protein
MKRVLVLVAGLAVAGMLVAGCEKKGGGDGGANASSAASAQSGSHEAATTGTLQGQVYAVGGIPTATGWPPPYRAVCTVVVLDNGHNAVKEVSTDATGHFETTLVPGTYYLRVKETRPIAGTAETGPFAVPEGGSVSASAHYDDGRR